MDGRARRTGGARARSRRDHSSDLVHLTRFETPLGRMTLASNESGVVACSLPGREDRVVERWLARTMPSVAVEEGTGRNAAARDALLAYLEGRRRRFDDVALDMRGTAFQRRVWQALRAIPYGETITYGELARTVGRPGAARACGAANGANPLPLLVPCHRVVAAGGGLGGFGGGLPLKRRLLDLEREMADGAGQGELFG